MTLVPSSSHPSSGGGGFTIGSSYITAHDDSLVAKASGAFPALTFSLGQGSIFTQPDSAGTDLEIHAADHTKIDVLTTGWYQLSVVAPLGPDNPADTVVGMELSVQPGTLGSFAFWGGECAGLPSAIDGTAICLTTPVIEIPAGETIQSFLGVYLSNIANTWTAGTCKFSAMRFG